MTKLEGIYNACTNLLYALYCIRGKMAFKYLDEYSHAALMHVILTDDYGFSVEFINDAREFLELERR